MTALQTRNGWLIPTSGGMFELDHLRPLRELAMLHAWMNDAEVAEFWDLAGPRENPDRHIAAFDLENTLIASNVVESFAWLATRRMGGDERVRFTMRTLREAPGLLALDRRDRGDFLRYFYRR